MNAPKKIWIDNEPYEYHWHDTEDSVDNYIPEYCYGKYIRADLVEALVKACDELTPLLDIISYWHDLPYREEQLNRIGNLKTALKALEEYHD